jgi:hypothetical protein
MVLRQPLFEQNDTTDQDAHTFRMFLHDLCNGRAGLIQEDAMKVVQRSAGANNSVDIGAGAFIIHGSEGGNLGDYYVTNDGVVNLPMSTAAHGSLPRIDCVAVRVRDSFYSTASNDAEFVYVPGTAAAAPVSPNMDALGYENYARLAHISVPANDNTITTAEITDVRVTYNGRASALGGAWVSSNAPTLPRLGQLWFDTGTSIFKVNVGSSASPNWSNISYHTSWSSFTPSWSNVTLGSGATNFGRYIKLGRTAIAVSSFILGTGGDVTSILGWNPPTAIPIVMSIGANVVTGFAWADVAGLRYGATCIHTQTDVAITRFVSSATNIGWQATIPANWTSGSQLDAMFIYETAS